MTDQPEFGLIKDLVGGQQVVVALQAGVLEHGTHRDGAPRRTPYRAGAAFLLSHGLIVAGPVERDAMPALADFLLGADRLTTDTTMWRALAAAVIAFSPDA
jgi:hypothetical protein